MTKIQFVINGGLGNQIFQYLASKFISYEHKNHTIGYSFLSRDRNFELNNLLKDKISLEKEIRIKKKDKLIYALLEKFFLKRFNTDQKINTKLKIKHELNELDFDYGKRIIDRTKILSQKIDYNSNLSHDYLKVIGFWENPNSLLIYENKFKDLFIDTTHYLPDYLIPNHYITMHIRRGDYVESRSQIQSLLSRYSSIQHLINSLTLIPSKYENLPLYVLTDDIKWTNSWIYLFSEKSKNEIRVLSNSSIIDWSIIRHAAINICANSTFSYTAALLNYSNKNNKLRCIIPQWHRIQESTYEKGWSSPLGFIEV